MYSNFKMFYEIVQHVLAEQCFYPAAHLPLSARLMEPGQIAPSAPAYKAHETTWSEAAKFETHKK